MERNDPPDRPLGTEPYGPEYMKIRVNCDMHSVSAPFLQGGADKETPHSLLLPQECESNV